MAGKPQVTAWVRESGETMAQMAQRRLQATWQEKQGGTGSRGSDQGKDGGGNQTQRKAKIGSATWTRRNGGERDDGSRAATARPPPLRPPSPTHRVRAKTAAKAGGRVTHRTSRRMNGHPYTWRSRHGGIPRGLELTNEAAEHLMRMDDYARTYTMHNIPILRNTKAMSDLVRDWAGWMQNDEYLFQARGWVRTHETQKGLPHAARQRGGRVRELCVVTGWGKTWKCYCAGSRCGNCTHFLTFRPCGAKRGRYIQGQAAAHARECMPALHDRDRDLSARQRIDDRRIAQRRR